MPTAPAIEFSGTVNNGRVRLYVGIAAVLYLSLLCAMILNGRLLHSAFLIGTPALVFVITQPRLALYAFVFLMFIPLEIVPGAKLFVYDIGAGVVILAAALDLLLRESSEKRLPPLTRNYLVLLIVLFLAGAFGYSLVTSIRPMIRVALILLVFLSVYRLSERTSVSSLLRFFFWVCTAHAGFALAEFVIARGQIRSFGLVTIGLDDFAMLAAPVGLGFFLWATPGKSLRYAVGTVVTLGGLIATQSRAPLIFAVAACGFLLLLAARRNRVAPGTTNGAPVFGLNPSAPLVRRRIRWILTSVVAALAAIFALKALLFSGVIGRFEHLLTTSPGGTFRLRMVLWTQALDAFRQHPLLGIGPGNFRNLAEIIPTVRLDPLNYYVRGLSAHNLMLHYLAETGLLGVTALLALFANQFRLACKTWRESLSGFNIDIAAILLTLSGLLLLTTLFEAAWMWSEFSLVAASIIALIARSRRTAV